MKVLIIKLSSMGDTIHTLPAITDSAQAHPHIQFDWIIEEKFTEIPAWHPQVHSVIPIALRRWRGNIIHAITQKEWHTFYQQLKSTTYDSIIDPQGLMKSATIAKLATGKTRHGFDWQSAREPLSSIVYQHRHKVPKNQHAILRIRQLFSQSLSYQYAHFPLDYGINQDQLNTHTKLPHSIQTQIPYIVFIHGSSRIQKCWPTDKWSALAKQLTHIGFQIKVLWGSSAEHEIAKTIAQTSSQIEVLPALSISQIAKLLISAKGIIAVDTGLGHLSAALNKPTISLYGPTNPHLIGTLGENQIHLNEQDTCNNIQVSTVWSCIKKQWDL